MSNHRWAPPTIVALGLWALVLAGCRIPTDEQAREVDGVPRSVFSTTTSLVEVAEPDETEFSMELYFYNSDDQLVIIERPVDETPTLGRVLSELQALAPEEQEAFPGTVTKLLQGSQLRIVDTDENNGSITVQVNDEYATLVEDNQVRNGHVFSQIVCSLTSNSSFDFVTIRDSNSTLRVQDAVTGEVKEGLVGRSNLNDCKTAEDLLAEATAEAQASNSGTDSGTGDNGS